MSVSNILGNTDNETDARKVPWVNIVCNSIYAINSKTKNVVAEEGTIQDLNSDDATIQDLTVSNINSYPPTIIGVQKYTWPGPNHDHNFGDPPYTLPLSILVLNNGLNGSEYSGNPGEIKILISGVYLINYKIPIVYTGGVLTTTRNYGSTLLVNNVAVTRTAAALWGGFTCYAECTTILLLNQNDIISVRFPVISAGQGGPLQIGNGTSMEFSVVKLL